MSDPNERQVAGTHYRSDYQHWDFVHDVGLTYLQGQAVKYLSRWTRKGGIQDLYKAEHFLQKMVAERDKAGHTTQEYITANQIGDEEGDIIFLITMGQFIAAKTQMDNFIREAQAAEPQPHGYVNQDGPSS